jgi:hypothetical protein
VRIGSTIAAAAAALTVAPCVRAQEVIKPTTTTTATATRLAAPTGLSARQLSDGRILVTWKPVAGAVGYSIWRSVPPSGTTLVSEGQTDTAYYDGDVKAGSYHYYLVAALSAGGGVGMKAGPPPVNATMSTTSTASTGDASLEIRRLVPNEIGDGVWITVYAPGRAGQRVVLERAVVTTTKLDWQERIRSQLPLRVADSLTGFGDRFTDVPAGTTLRWRAFAIDSAGVRSAPATSSDFTVPQYATTTASSTPTTASTTPLGNVVVSMATPVSLRIGATASLTTALGGMTARRWVSLHEGIATVDAMGTATGRAAGQAQVVAIGLAADGSVRVTVVRVTVTQ